MIPIALIVIVQEWYSQRGTRQVRLGRDLFGPCYGGNMDAVT